MEGPSLYLAAEQLAPFVGYFIQEVSGNTKKIEKERLRNKEILSIFSFGKQLFFQFDTFALRVHFLLFGSFEATVEGKKVTGDYPAKSREPRLALELSNGYIKMYNCSVRFIENSNIWETCDFSIDIMSDSWDEKKAFKNILNYQKSQITDVLLDQSIFAGVGNIIKNEVLLLAKICPLIIIEELTNSEIKKIIRITRKYVFKFYNWRKKFVLKKHYNIYRQSYCKVCGSKVTRRRTGERKRITYFCPLCEKCDKIM